MLKNLYDYPDTIKCTKDQINVNPIKQNCTGSIRVYAGAYRLP